MEQTFLEGYVADSSLIKRIEYSYCLYDGKKVSEKLTVYFQRGEINEYSVPFVPPILPPFDMEKFFTEFTRAESVGKFWHKNIKNLLPYKRLK